VDDLAYLKLAVNLASKGKYTSSPNPQVGCVIVKDNQVLAQGWHQTAGGPHAEVAALAQLNYQAAGATAYVSLEPCCHTGKTAPCSAALITAGIKRVVIGATDPNPLVAGKGIAALKNAGIEVDTDLLLSEVREQNKGFFSRMLINRPWVSCKIAISLDGRTSGADGASKWLSGASARSDVQQLRATSCVIVSGIGTVLADDPQLNLRSEQIADYPAGMTMRQPATVILDSQLQTPVNAKLLANNKVIIAAIAPDSADKIAFAKRQSRLEQQGAAIVLLPSDNNRVALESLLSLLATYEFNQVLVEAGPTLCASWLQQGLIDELIVYLTPKILGSLARSMFDLPLATLAQQYQLKLQSVAQIDEDVKLIYSPKEM
jgi:diaminohydroxyphosphoribosylaminopyrimidine deaminase / 5-amino-6-(5-phosphoribosylamino)uracil reductase